MRSEDMDVSPLGRWQYSTLQESKQGHGGCARWQAAQRPRAERPGGSGSASSILAHFRRQRTFVSSSASRVRSCELLGGSSYLTVTSVIYGEHHYLIVMLFTRLSRMFMVGENEPGACASSASFTSLA